VRISAGSLPKCNRFIVGVDQSVSWVSRTSGGDWLENANKSPNIPYSAMV